MKQPKVLLGCPTYAGKNYCVERWMERAKNLNYTNYDILIVDNTDDGGKNAQWLRDKFGVRVIHHYENKQTLFTLMTTCLNKVRDVVLKEGYEYFFSLEADVIPPENIIPTLMNLQKPIVSAMYRIGPPGWEFPLLQIMETTKEGGGKAEAYARQMFWHEMFHYIDGEVKPIFACGIGCTLMHRALLEAVPFREDEKNPFVYADSIFYLDLWNKNIENLVHTGILCKHLNRDWTLVHQERKGEFGDEIFNLKDKHLLEEKKNVK